MVDRFGPRLPLVIGGGATGALLAIGGYTPGVAALAICLFLSGIAGSLIQVAGTISVFHGFPAERRGTALGIRQMSVAAGGLVASFLLPGLAAIGGIGLALAASGILTAVTAISFGLASPGGALQAAVPGRKVMDVRGVLRTPGMLRLLLDRLPAGVCADHDPDVHRPGIPASGVSTAGAAVVFTVVSLRR